MFCSCVEINTSAHVFTSFYFSKLPHQCVVWIHCDELSKLFTEGKFILHSKEYHTYDLFYENLIYKAPNLTEQMNKQGGKVTFSTMEKMIIFKKFSFLFSKVLCILNRKILFLDHQYSSNFWEMFYLSSYHVIGNFIKN